MHLRKLVSCLLASLLWSRTSSLLPLCLTDIYNTEHLKKPFNNLLKIGKETEVSVNASQAKAVGAKTRGQAKSCLRFRMRTGRITASKLKAVRCTEPAMPAVSLRSKLSSGDVSMRVWHERSTILCTSLRDNTKSIDMDTLEVVEGAQHSPSREFIMEIFRDNFRVKCC